MALRDSHGCTSRQIIAPSAPSQSTAAAKRGRGFGIQALAAVVLWVGALGAIVWRLVHG